MANNSEDEAPCVAILDRDTVWRALDLIYRTLHAGDAALAMRQLEHLGRQLLVDSAVEERDSIIGIYAEHDAIPYETHQ